MLEYRLKTPFQSAFTTNDFTINQLIYLYHTFCEAIDNGREVRAVFCDISKAFDRVWHKGLLHELSSVGFKCKVLDWLSSYLSERKQRVFLMVKLRNGQLLQRVFLRGPFLAPCSFFYINDIVNQIYEFFCRRYQPI